MGLPSKHSLLNIQKTRMIKSRSGDKTVYWYPDQSIASKSIYRPSTTPSAIRFSRARVDLVMSATGMSVSSTKSSFPRAKIVSESEKERVAERDRTGRLSSMRDVDASGRAKATHTAQFSGFSTGARLAKMGAQGKAKASCALRSNCVCSFLNRRSLPRGDDSPSLMRQTVFESDEGVLRTVVCWDLLAERRST
jgi:hypothetical protein